jgi:hypothetical protein
MLITEAQTLHGRLLLRAEQPTAVGRTLKAVLNAHRPVDSVDGHDLGVVVCRCDLATYPCATIETAARELDIAVPGQVAR